MAVEEGFELGSDLPALLASVLDKTEYICQNVGKGTAEARAEVIDQSIRVLRSIRDCHDIHRAECLLFWGHLLTVRQKL